MEFLEVIFTQNGLMAALFVGLLVWVLKKNDDREIRYIDTINKITNNIKNELDNIKGDIEVIKHNVKGGYKSNEDRKQDSNSK